MADILYEYEGKLYINLTNQCPCRCTFCVRSQTDRLGSAQSLWLERNPTAGEVISGLGQYRLENYPEVVFCGYGEPFCALDVMLEVSDFLRSRGCRVRVNTNGLGDLILKKPTAPLLKGRLDVVSISLNAPNAQRYCEITRPSFGPEAFEAMLKFARECRDSVPQVAFSVVDVISPEEISACQALADEMGIPLRVRRFSRSV